MPLDGKYDGDRIDIQTKKKIDNGYIQLISPQETVTERSRAKFSSTQRKINSGEFAIIETGANSLGASSKTP